MNNAFLVGCLVIAVIAAIGAVAYTISASTTVHAGSAYSIGTGVTMLDGGNNSNSTGDRPGCEPCSPGCSC